jgi:DNA-binding GntR family transcriptional regulator
MPAPLRSAADQPQSEASIALRKGARTLKRIASILEKGLAAAAAKRFDQLPALNDQFHQELAEAGQNRLLGELLRRLREQTAMLFAPGEPERQARFWNEHAGILRAIPDGNEDEAAARAAEHVMHAHIGFPSEPGPARAEAT